MSINKYIKFFDINSNHYRGNKTDIDVETLYENHIYKVDCPGVDWNNGRKRFIFLGTLDSALDYGDQVVIFHNKSKINLLNFSLENRNNSIKYIKKLSVFDSYLAYCLQCMYGIYNDFNSFKKFNLSIDDIINETINIFKKVNVSYIRFIECYLLCLLIPYGLSSLIKENINIFIININKKYRNNNIIIAIKFVMQDGKIKIYIEYQNRFTKIYLVNNENLFPTRVSYLHLDKLVIRRLNEKSRKIIYQNIPYKINGIYSNDDFINNGICRIIMDIFKLINIEKHGNTCIVSDYVIFNNTLLMPKYIIIKKYDDNDELEGYILQPINNCNQSGVFSIKLTNYQIYNTLDEIIQIL